MASTSTRPWYRLHWLTWLVLMAVIVAILLRTSQPGMPMFAGSLGYTKLTSYGWPQTHLRLIETGLVFPPPGQVPEYTYDWQAVPLLANAAMYFALAASVAFVAERWLLSRNRWQVTLGSLLTLTIVIAILLGVVSGSIETSLGQFGVDFPYLLNWYDVRQPLRCPLVFALACTIYTVGWLAWTSSHRLLAVLHRDR